MADLGGGGPKGGNALGVGLGAVDDAMHTNPTHAPFAGFTVLQEVPPGSSNGHWKPSEELGWGHCLECSEAQWIHGASGGASSDGWKKLSFPLIFGGASAP